MGCRKEGKNERMGREKALGERHEFGRLEPDMIYRKFMSLRQWRIAGE